MKTTQIIFLSIFLAIICTIATAVLAFTYKGTKEDIKKMKEEKIAKALKVVLGSFDNNPVQTAKTLEYNGRQFTFYPAEKDGKLFAYAVRSISPKGYGGQLSVMIEIGIDGKIGTVIVTENNETPGLGTAATDRKRTKTLADLLSGKKNDSLPPNPVLDSFRDKDCAAVPWKFKKDGGEIDSITGATISSTAVLDAVNYAAQAFKNKKLELLQNPIQTE